MIYSYSTLIFLLFDKGILSDEDLELIKAGVVLDKILVRKKVFLTRDIKECKRAIKMISEESQALKGLTRSEVFSYLKERRVNLTREKVESLMGMVE